MRQRIFANKSDNFATANPGLAASNTVQRRKDQRKIQSCKIPNFFKNIYFWLVMMLIVFNEVK